MSLPDSWKIQSLQDLCRETISYGIVQCGPHIRNGIPYIRVSDMDHRELDVEGMLRTSPDIAARFVRSTVEAGDLVYALRGKLGEVRKVPLEVAGANLTQGTARIAPRSEVSSDYLMWAMRGPDAIRQAGYQAKGSTFVEITLENLRNIQIVVPPATEQRVIAAALSDVDALIAGLEKLIAKKRDLKQATMQQLLTGQTRLPGFSGEWEAKRLGDLANVLKGRGLSKGHLVSSGTNSCILYGELFTTYERVINSVISKTNSPEGLLGLNGDVLLPGSTTTKGIDLAVASALQVNNIQLGGDINVIRMKHASSYDPVFMAYLLTHTKKLAIADLAQGSTIIHLYGRSLLNLMLKLPVISEQTAIATALSSMDAEIAALEIRLTKTRELKQGMMQELLTGRTRLV